MPNIKSAKKRVILSKQNNEQNRAIKTAIKTKIKKFDAAVASGEDATQAYKDAFVALDKAGSKGILHKNNVARRKSQLTLKLNNK